MKVKRFLVVIAAAGAVLFGQVTTVEAYYYGGLYDGSSSLENFVLDMNKRYREEKEREYYQQIMKDFNSLVAQGDKFYANKNYSAAIDSYAKARRYSSKRIDEFYTNLVNNGDKLAAQGQHLAALDYYKKAVIMKPTDNDCSNRLWKTYSNTKNFDDAVSFYGVIAEVYPKDSYNWFILAYSYSQLNDHENAIAAYTRSLSLKPDFAGGYKNRGKSYYNLGQYALAIQDFDNKIKLEPESNDYNWRGHTYEKMEKYKKSLKDYQKALKLNPNDEYAKKAIERVSKMK